MLQRTPIRPLLRPSALRRSAVERMAYVSIPILALWALVALVLGN